MNPRTGVVLRLLGPLIEIACLILLRRYGDRGLSLLGQPVETWLNVGFASGLILVAAGLILVRRPKPEGRSLDDEGSR